jgi:hypothetical protein
VTLFIGPRTRALLIVLVLSFAAAGAGLMVLARAQTSNDASPEPVTPPKKTQLHVAPKASQAPRPATTTPARRARSGASDATASGRLPVAIRQALAANHVVVVALYDPKAKIDGTALQEASAGAQLAGTTFVSVNVTTKDVDSLNLRYGVIQDPAVLVLRPPGDLVVRIDGFADRDTVAQAAANAAS